MDTVALLSLITRQVPLACSITTAWSDSSPPTQAITTSSPIAPTVTLASPIELE